MTLKSTVKVMTCHWVNEWIKKIIMYNLNSLMYSIRFIWMFKAASYLDLHLSIGRDGLLRNSLYDKRDDFNSFRSWEATSNLRPPMAFLSHNSSDTPGLALLINVLFWGRCDFPIKSSLRKFYGRYGELTKQYEVLLSRMLNDILDDDHIQWHLPLIRNYTNFWQLLIWTLLPNLTF